MRVRLSHKSRGLCSQDIDSTPATEYAIKQIQTNPTHGLRSLCSIHLS